MSDHKDVSDHKEGHEPELEPLRMTEGERQRQRRRSIAIACMLLGLVVLFYLVTIVRMGSNVAKRAI